MVKVDKFIKMKYDQEKLASYQGDGKCLEKTLNHISFEMVHDMLNPVKNCLPFIMSDLNSEDGDSFFKNQSLSNRSKYSTYLCLMNLDKYSLIYEEQDD